MSGLSRIMSLMAVAFVVGWLGIPGVARAQAARSQGLHVLAIDSDDSDEQADALTNALRSRVRETAGWTLVDTTQSLSMLTAAFQCPQRPDAACLDRIGDKLKADQFVWGVMSKAPGHQVTAEVHLWGHGKPDKSAKETYSDNLKDANDDNLKKIAALIFGKLVGATTGTLSLHASTDAGNVLVDGVQKASLDHGRATVALPAGPHTVEVQATGFAPGKKDVSIDPGGTSQVEIVLTPAPAEAAAPGKPLPLRAIAGWSSIGVGAVLVAVGVGFGVGFLGDQSDLNNQRKDNYTLPLPVVQDPCNPPSGSANQPTETGCQDVKSAHAAVAGEITTLALGGVLAGVGIYLLATDHHADTPPSSGPTGLSSFKLLPSAGPGGGSMVVVGQF
jgi:hypothetical protein